MKKRSQSVNVKHRKISFGDFQTETIGISVKKILIEVPLKIKIELCFTDVSILFFVPIISSQQTYSLLGSAFLISKYGIKNLSVIVLFIIHSFIGNFKKVMATHPYNHLSISSKKKNFTRVRKAKSEIFLKKNSQKMEG